MFGISENVIEKIILKYLNSDKFKIEGVSESLDTLKEIGEWIQTHSEEFKELLSVKDKLNENVIQITETLDKLKIETDEKLDQLKLEILGDDLAETFNTLLEVQKWADKHGTEYAELVTTVNNVEQSVSDLDTKVDDKVKELDNKRKYVFDTLTDKINSVISDFTKHVSLAEETYQVKGDYVEYSTFQENRKTIQLDNNNTISGLTTDGKGVNVAMVSKWDVVDLGSSQLPINLNTPKNVRPTVQEAGQSGEEAHKIAYVSDVENLTKNVDDIFDVINEKLETCEKTDKELDEKIDKSVEDLTKEIDEHVSIEDKKLDKKIDDSVKELTDKIDEHGSLAEDTYQVKGDYVEFKPFTENRKTIELKNHDTISGLKTDGSGVNIAMVSKWNKVDLGSGNALTDR